MARDRCRNAYNNFGGRSNYIHPDQLPDEPTMNARMELKRCACTYATRSEFPLAPASALPRSWLCYGSGSGSGSALALTALLLLCSGSGSGPGFGPSA